MRVPRPFRAILLIPAIAVTALLSGAAPLPPLPGPPPPPIKPPCDHFASAVAGDSTVQIPNKGVGIEQALPAGISVAACSLRTRNSEFPGPIMALREWDPATLAPDSETIALRRAFVFPSIFPVDATTDAGLKLPMISFVPPVVTSSVAGVAEPPRPQLALQLVNQRLILGLDWELTCYFTPEGPAELPAAVKLNADSTREPLPGPHPVLAHAVCAGDADLATLRIVQSVRRTDVKPFPAPKEFMQRFRVPERVELRWIELALAEVFTPYFERFAAIDDFPGPGPRPFFGIPVLAVIDGEAMPEPPAHVPSPMVEAPFDLSALVQASQGMGWVSHSGFDRTVTLEPDHDYWIWVRDAAATTFLNRRTHGDEPPEFTAGVGPYFARTDTAGEWIRAADQVLAFRVVGRPGASSPPPPPPASFALSTTPNPAPGSVRVAWSGAVGSVRFDVLDPRGRRVSEGLGGAAGTWTWPGTDRNGRAVASGIYFVRARDSAGRESVDRVVVMR